MWEKRWRDTFFALPHLMAVPLSRSDPVPGLVRSRQRFVRRCHRGWTASEPAHFSRNGTPRELRGPQGASSLGELQGASGASGRAVTSRQEPQGAIGIGDQEPPGATSNRILFFSSLPSGSGLFNCKVFQLLSFFNRRDKPTGSCTPTRPSVACPVSIFRRDLLPPQ